MSVRATSRPYPPRTTSNPATFADMVKVLPDRVGTWTARPPDRLCDRRTIYDYMDGAAEVYLTYAYAGLVVRQYGRSPESSIIVELFDMTGAFDAFGVFSNGRDEDLRDAGIGQGAELRDELLTFWKDRYFVAVRVDADDVRPSVRASVAKLGRAVAAAIGKTGALPEVLAYLPADGLIKHSVRYVYLPDALNYHYDFGPGNLLRLDARTQAVLATYRRDKVRCHLLCVLYPTEALAAEARRRFVAEFARRVDRDGAARIGDDRWVGLQTHGCLLAAALDVPTRGAAIKLADLAIKQYRASRPGSKNKEHRP